MTSDILADFCREDHPIALPGNECVASSLNPARKSANLNPIASAPLPAECAFYDDYAWCLNPQPVIRDVLARLYGEIAKFEDMPQDWRTEEIAANIYLFAGALLNQVDEYLRGPTLRLPRKLSANSLGKKARGAVERFRGFLARKSLANVRAWREVFLASLDNFLIAALIPAAPEKALVIKSALALAAPSPSHFPAALLDAQIGVPSPFRRLDLTHHDVLELARRLAERIADRNQPILLVGLRTSGAYFAPLVRAYLRSRGFQCVSLMTLQPDKGVGRIELRQLQQCAVQDYFAVVIDDPPLTAGTIFLAMDIACRAGFAPAKLMALAPAHSAARNWHKPLTEERVITLEPELWRKQLYLRSQDACDQVREYFREEKVLSVKAVVKGLDANANCIQLNQSNRRGARLKQLFEVRLQRTDGPEEIRYVLAKSVGWGWLGYHAFLCASRLSPFVPPLLGLRNGVLYTQWVSQNSDTPIDRHKEIDRVASYVAARVHELPLQENPLLGNGEQRHHNGFCLLESALSRAYGGVFGGALARPRLAAKLRALPCPFPTLIDGKMDRDEWIPGDQGSIKTDFEHHGMGKAALNVIDPAYDIADTILKMRLSPLEERRLIDRYKIVSKDEDVDDRLFINKLIAGLWSMQAAQSSVLAAAGSPDEQQHDHRRFMDAWDFLTIHTARQCGEYCRPDSVPHWQGPLVFMDIDGVLDRRLFGFPLTSNAGIEALSLLHESKVTIALNTARSVREVKEYCAAYGLAGGIAEHGAYLWDAVAQRGKTLVCEKAQRQLDQLRDALRRTSGVFLDERHEYSIRAFTYQSKPQGGLERLVHASRSFDVGDGAVAPLSPMLIRHMITALGLDALEFHNTMIDTTVTIKGLNKGVGLTQMRDWMVDPQAETIAVGDSRADLPMFSVATRCFAPANIDCASPARLLGCRVSRHPYQRGLLEIAEWICQDIKPRDDDPQDLSESAPRTVKSAAEKLFADVLHAADTPTRKHLIRALFDRATYKILER